MLEKTLETARKIQPVHPKGDQSWVFIGRTDVEAETLILWDSVCKELTHWKRPWCWERLKAGEGGDNRGWDGWMASSTQWTWVWVNSGSWWWTGCAAGHGVAKSRTRLSSWTEVFAVLTRQNGVQSPRFTFHLPLNMCAYWVWVLSHNRKQAGEMRINNQGSYNFPVSYTALTVWSTALKFLAELQTAQRVQLFVLCWP